MEVVVPNRDALDSFSWEKKRRSEFEERKDQVTRLVLRRSISVPENLSSSSDDSDSYSSSYSRPRGNIPSRSISSQGLVTMIDHDDDDDDDDDDEGYIRAEVEADDVEYEEDEVKVFPNKGKRSKASRIWSGIDDDDDSSYYCSSDEEYTDTESNGKDDLKRRDQDYKICPPPLPAGW